MDKDKFIIAQFGKSFGLKGELKLNLHTDFPEQFIKDRVLDTDRGKLKIEYFNPKKGIIKIEGVNTPENAKKLTNANIYSNKNESYKYCNLKEGEYFWFDLIGLKVIEDNLELGVVKDIIRYPNSDYFNIASSLELIKKSLPKNFLLPNIPKFIQKIDLDKKKLYVKGAKDILEAS